MGKITASVSRADGGRGKKAIVKAQRGVASGFAQGTMMVKVFRFWVCSEHRTTGGAFSTHVLRPSSTQPAPAETQVMCWVMVEKQKGGRHSL